jgi:maleate isomerase
VEEQGVVAVNRVRRIGVITPSSNSVLEPTAIAVTSPLYPRVSTHYTRIEVKTISLEQQSLAQFETRHFVRAARLLADAGMDVIAWNGTAGSWQGIASDEAICRAITDSTGVPATTATLAQLKVFEQYGVCRYALAVPYLASVRDAIVRMFASRGVVCTGSATLEISVNAACADVQPGTIRDLVTRADNAEAAAIVSICTDLPAAWLVAELEQTCLKPVFDSTLVTILQRPATGLCRYDTGRMGRLLPRPLAAGPAWCLVYLAFEGG